jgi:hypothetical protein
MQIAKAALCAAINKKEGFRKKNNVKKKLQAKTRAFSRAIGFHWGQEV